MKTLRFGVAALVALVGCSQSTMPGTDAGGRTDARATLDADMDAGVGCCVIDAECDDGSFCNGEETCSSSALECCLPGTPPCPPGACDEAAGRCTSDAGVADAGPSRDATTSATVTITAFGSYGNCFPVPPDPIMASWHVTIAGATGSTAMLTSARLTITGSSTVVQMLTVDMPTIALTGGAGSGDQRKVAADVNPSDACGELCGGSTARIDLVFVIDGVPVTASATVPYECAV